MFPSIETIGLGFAITAVLALIDWYVWRTAPTLPFPLLARHSCPDAACSPRLADDDAAADFQEVA